MRVVAGALARPLAGAPEARGCKPDAVPDGPSGCGHRMSRPVGGGAVGYGGDATRRAAATVLSAREEWGPARGTRGPRTTAPTSAGPSSRESVEPKGLSPCTHQPSPTARTARLTDSWPARAGQRTSTTSPARTDAPKRTITTSPSWSAGDIDGPRTATRRQRT